MSLSLCCYGASVLARWRRRAKEEEEKERKNTLAPFELLGFGKVLEEFRYIGFWFSCRFM